MAKRDAKIVMQAMVPRRARQAKQVVGLVPKVRVLYQEARAPAVLRAHTKTKLLESSVNYVLRAPICRTRAMTSQAIVLNAAPAKPILTLGLR